MRRRAAAAAVLACALAGCARRPLTVTFVDVGQGDAIVIQTPSGGTLAVDAGRRGDGGDDAARRAVVPYARARGIDSLDGLLITHADDDHAGGAPTLVRRLRPASLLVPPRLLVSPPGDHEQAAREALQRCRSGRVPIRAVGRGMSLRFRDGVTVEVLHPPADWPSDGPLADNDGCVVARVRYGSTALLLLGDAQEAAIASMLRARLDLRADVLKVSHHGSRNGLPPGLLEACRPGAAVVSVGRGNVYGHPHPAVLDALRHGGARVFRTDIDGTVSIDSDGVRLRIRTAIERPRGVP